MNSVSHFFKIGTTIMLVLCACFSFAQTTITLQPDSVKGKDAFLYSRLPSTNYGKHTDFAAMAWTHSGNEVYVRTLVDFNLTCIPKGAVISSAILSLYGYASPGNGSHSTTSGSNEAVISRVTAAWDEDSVTWSNQPTIDTLKQVTLAASTSSNQDYLNIDVKTIVSDMITDSIGQFGFMLQLVTEKYYRSLIFGSSDNADSTLHPKLEITYTVPVDTEGCVTMRLGECGKDAFVYDRLPSTNYGDHGDFAAMGWTHSGSAVQVRSLVEFDLSSIPNGVTIDSAKLSLYGYASPGNGSHSTTSGSNKSFVKRITKSWQENTVTWNNQPSTTVINQATLSASTVANQDYLDINVTNMVTDMIGDSTGVHGFMLQLENEAYYRSLVFGSSDNSNAALHPQLVVCYSIDAVSDENVSSRDEFDFNLYPNPASATVTIQSNLKGNLQAVVLNSVGQAISAVNSFEKSINIDVSGFSAGLYYVQVLNGSASTIKKLVIQ